MSMMAIVSVIFWPAPLLRYYDWNRFWGQARRTSSTIVTLVGRKKEISSVHEFFQRPCYNGLVIKYGIIKATRII